MRTRLISKLSIIAVFVAVFIFGTTQDGRAWGTMWIFANNLCWNGTLGPGNVCPAMNGNCAEYIGIPVPSIGVQKNPSGTLWELNGVVGDSSTAVSPGGEIALSPNNFTFPPGSLLQIDSGMFSGIPALTFDLSGITTDDTGGFTASTPVY